MIISVSYDAEGKFQGQTMGNCAKVFVDGEELVAIKSTSNKLSDVYISSKEAVVIENNGRVLYGSYCGRDIFRLHEWGCGAIGLMPVAGHSKAISFDA